MAFREHQQPSQSHVQALRCTTQQLVSVLNPVTGAKYREVCLNGQTWLTMAALHGSRVNICEHAVNMLWIVAVALRCWHVRHYDRVIVHTLDGMCLFQKLGQFGQLQQTQPYKTPQ